MFNLEKNGLYDELVKKGNRKLLKGGEVKC